MGSGKHAIASLILLPGRPAAVWLDGDLRGVCGEISFAYSTGEQQQSRPLSEAAS